MMGCLQVDLRRGKIAFNPLSVTTSPIPHALPICRRKHPSPSVAAIQTLEAEAKIPRQSSSRAATHPSAPRIGLPCVLVGGVARKPCPTLFAAGLKLDQLLRACLDVGARRDAGLIALLLHCPRCSSRDWRRPAGH